MKRAYWFLILFGLWCVASGYWYMFAVRGIQTDPRFFDAHVRWVAIVEILVMLLMACLMGFGMGWALRDGSMESLRALAQRLEEEKESLSASKQAAQEKLQHHTTQLHLVQQDFTVRLNRARQEAESLQDELLGLQKKLEHVPEIKPSSNELLQLENEVGALRYREKQLEFQNREIEENNRKLKLELQESLSRKSHAEPIHPFVRPIELNEHDDLTLIKGIGPFIEKRLNMIGIYTFRQISEFTPEVIEHVTKAIEFFPDRIVRDNWVGQAVKFL